MEHVGLQCREDKYAFRVFELIRTLLVAKLLTMTRVIILLALVSISANAVAQTNTAAKTVLSEGAKVIFKNVKSKTTEAEKNFIYQKLQVKLTKDKKSFTLEGQPVDVQVFPVDLNSDGVEEVFVTLASGFLFGNTGQTVLLFMKDKAGKFQQQTEIAGGIAMILNTKNQGYPDIAVGGPGFEHPSFRWNGKDYRYHKAVKDESLATTSTSLEVFSKAYIDTLK
jgi:hypothetical protein